MTRPTQPRWRSPTVAQECAAAEYFERLRWGDVPTCPYCGSLDFHREHSRGRWYCRACQRQSTVRYGTVLAGSRVPLYIWQRAVVREGQPQAALELAAECGLILGRAHLLLGALRAARQRHQGRLFAKAPPHSPRVGVLASGEYLLPRVGWRFRPYRRGGGSDYATVALLRFTGLRKQYCRLHPRHKHLHVLTAHAAFCYRAWGFEVARGGVQGVLKH